MAGGDYLNCSQCGGKGIYDEDWYERVWSAAGYIKHRAVVCKTDEMEALRARIKHDQEVSALCMNCSQTHRLVVVERDAGHRSTADRVLGDQRAETRVATPEEIVEAYSVLELAAKYATVTTMDLDSSLHAMIEVIECVKKKHDETTVN